MPGNGRRTRGDAQCGQIVERAGRTVLSGDPFRINEREFSVFYGDRLMREDDPLRRRARIENEGHRIAFGRQRRRRRKSVRGRRLRTREEREKRYEITDEAQRGLAAVETEQLTARENLGSL